jgi:hypothetical protein
MVSFSMRNMSNTGEGQSYPRVWLFLPCPVPSMLFLSAPRECDDLENHLESLNHRRKESQHKTVKGLDQSF